MSRRVLIAIAAIVIVIAVGLVLSLKRALKADALSADPDPGGRNPPRAAPR
ncbi:MAG TPA: hypothetical protein VEG27_01955 [Usitatibacter sp.]|nr:hypothetical protein [Usitatibacter sp.]